MAASASRLLLVFVFLVVVVAATTPADAASAKGTLKAPAEVQVGSRIEVHWAGPVIAGDFVSIDVPGEPEAKYGSIYGYPATANPVVLTAPDRPGAYVVRFHRAADYGVEASIPLTVTDVGATVSVPARVAAGAEFDVEWTGPGNSQDFVSIDPTGAPDREYGPYAYTRPGQVAKVRAPDASGNYEVRYHMANSYRVIGRAPIVVGEVAASLDAPASARAGSTLEVGWTGPAQDGDFVSIDAVGAPDRDYGPYAYTKDSPAAVRVPDAPGDYALRYHTAQSYRVLATRQLTVVPASAALTAPAEVVAGHVFEVRWEGPNDADDFVTLVPATAEETSYGSNNGYTKRGNPLRIEAAREPGDYEVRYLTGQSHRLLARAKLRIVPDTRVGRLRVAAAPGAAETDLAAVELVLDASGSMLQRIGGERRIDIARRALGALTREIPSGTGFALRVFGHREADSCRTDLEIPLAPIDVAAATQRIDRIDAKNLAKTPIAASLELVKDDLAAARGSVLVVLVTDGEETCEGDPAAAIAGLAAAGMHVRVNIVGFAVDEVALKETFQSWARAGHGGYFDAQSGEQLTAAMRASLQSIFEVRNAGRVVASGVVGGAPIELAPGTYEVRVPGTPRAADAVVVEPGATRDVAL
jgi:Mg-chelatase subunit ChlD